MGRPNNYGEKTVVVPTRVPDSKVSDFRKKASGILKGYQEEYLGISEKSNPTHPVPSKLTDIVDSKNVGRGNLDVESAEPSVEEEAIEVSENKNLDEPKKLNKARVVSLPPNARFVPNKVNNEGELIPLDKIYDCEEISVGVPEGMYRQYVDKRMSVGFFDRDDNDAYYALWGGIYYKFGRKKEFDRFFKEYGIV